MDIYSSLVIFSVLILCTSSFNHRRSKDDQLCEHKMGLLCVKNELMMIANIAKEIEQQAIEIEIIIQETNALETLNKYVNMEMNHTHSHSPAAFYHKLFFQQNNIDKTFLAEILVEGHNAMVYYYNSINDLLNLEVLYGKPIDEFYKKIQNTIQNELICRYRSIMHVYSYKWKSIHDIGRLEFSKRHLCPSCIHNIHSTVIAKYIQDWMNLINKVIVNLEMKFI